MRLALDLSSLTSGHRVRGLGFYTQRLKTELEKIFSLELFGFDQQPAQTVDLVHYPAFTLFTLPPRKPICPFVVTVHDLIPLKYPQQYPLGIKGRVFWTLQKLYLQKAAMIITDSQASKKDIVCLTHIPAEKIEVIYLAAGEEFKPLSNPALKLSLPKKFVLYVGDANYNKNLIHLANTCLNLGFPLVLAGKQITETDYDHQHPETKDLVELQTLIKANPNKIFPLGFVSTSDLVFLYNLATAYVQPSLDEGFGLPALEAMASGCPVLTSRAGSLPEICQGTDREFNSQNLKRVWQSPTLRLKMSKQGLAQAKKFSWQKTAQQTFKVYEKILQK